MRLPGGEVEAFRQIDFQNGGSPQIPAGPAEQVGGRGQGIALMGPDIAAAIAIPVLGAFQIGGGDELHLPHRARPGAGQLVAGGIAFIKHLADRDQLAFRPGTAAAFPGQGGEGLDDVIIARNGTIGTFQPPDRDQDFRPHLELRGDRIHGFAIAGIGVAAIADAQIGGGDLQIGPDRTDEFRLGAIGFDDPHLRLQIIQHGRNGLIGCSRRTQTIPKARLPVSEAFSLGLGQGAGRHQGQAKPGGQNFADHPFLVITASGSSPAISMISLRRSASTKSSCSFVGEMKAPGPVITSFSK